MTVEKVAALLGLIGGFLMAPRLIELVTRRSLEDIDQGVKSLSRSLSVITINSSYERTANAVSEVFFYVGLGLLGILVPCWLLFSAVTFFGSILGSEIPASLATVSLLGIRLYSISAGFIIVFLGMILVYFWHYISSRKVASFSDEAFSIALTMAKGLIGLPLSAGALLLALWLIVLVIHAFQGATVLAKGGLGITFLLAVVLAVWLNLTGIPKLLGVHDDVKGASILMILAFYIAQFLIAFVFGILVLGVVLFTVLLIWPLKALLKLWLRFPTSDFLLVSGSLIAVLGVLLLLFFT